MIDGLIRIADGENVAIGSGQQVSQLDLTEIGILKFVNQQKSRTPLLALSQLCLAAQQPDGVADHVPKRAQTLAAQQIFYGAESRGDFAASFDGLIARKRRG